MKLGHKIKKHQTKFLLTIFLFLVYFFLLFANFSPGDTYFSKLNLFSKAIEAQNWPLAKNLEKSLDPVDIQELKENNYPEFLLQKISSLKTLTPKTIDNQIEISKLYLKMGQKEDAKQAIAEARLIDPIREDLKTILSSLSL